MSHLFFEFDYLVVVEKGLRSVIFAKHYIHINSLILPLFVLVKSLLDDR